MSDKEVPVKNANINDKENPVLKDANMCDKETPVVGLRKAQDKRLSVPTEKALTNKIENIQTERKKHVSKMKSVIGTLKELMEDDENECRVKYLLNELMHLFENASELHHSLLPLMPSEEQEKQKVWFSSIAEYNEGFIEDVQIWLAGIAKRSGRPPNEVSSQKAPQEGAVILNEHAELHLPLCSQPDALDDVSPLDSVSNHGSRAGSKASLTSSAALVMAEAEMEALLTRQEKLKEIHSLEEQEERLRRKKEQLQIEADIAAMAAKANVLRSGSTVQNASQKPNGIECHLGVKEKAPRMLNADAKVFVPPTLSVKRKQNITAVNVKPKGTVVRQPMKAVASTPAPHLMASHAKLPHLPLRQTAQPATGDNVLSIMQTQSELTNMLVHQQNLLSLPKREIPVFDGSPLHFHAFMRSFEQVIESKATDPDDCLHYLAQYTRGQPNELVKSCQHMSDGAGYVKAKTLLYEHFGNEYVIASAYLNKIHSWPLIRSEDGEALQAYSLFLRGCCNAMEDVYGLSELDTPSNMLTVMKRLPYKLKDKWRTVACDIQEKQHRRATFLDIVCYLERQVKIATDPVFGKLCDPFTDHSTARGSDGGRPGPRAGARGSSFATTVAPMDRVDQIAPEEHHTNCLFCEGVHTLELCPLLHERTHNERINFLKENELCFGCLRSGHISRDCKSRLSCEICGFKHPRLLHVHREGNEVKRDAIVNDALVAVQTSGLTGAGEKDCKLAIIPVKVKSKKTQKTVETYAFLDPGSSASFCTVGLLEKLNLTGRKTKILLRTMGRQNVVNSSIVSDLEVAGLDSDYFCEMPDLFTQQSMPVSQHNIPKQQDLNNWPHLRRVYLPEIEAGVELLIGMNMPRALEPLELVRSVKNGPFAIKSVLGWTVSGLLVKDHCGRPESLSAVSANRISAVPIKPKKQLMDFLKCSHKDRLGPAREDAKFPEFPGNDEHVRDEHCGITLALKETELRMSDSKCANVEQHLDTDELQGVLCEIKCEYRGEYLYQLQQRRRLNCNFIVDDAVHAMDNFAPHSCWTVESYKSCVRPGKAGASGVGQDHNQPCMPACHKAMLPYGGPLTFDLLTPHNATLTSDVKRTGQLT